jgi:hypothetical protein
VNFWPATRVNPMSGRHRLKVAAVAVILTGTGLAATGAAAGGPAASVTAAALASRLPRLATAASISLSATLWGVSPGGNFTATLTKAAQLTDTATGTKLTCKSSALAGTLAQGRNLPAADLGSITSLTLDKCQDPAGQSVTITTSASAAHGWPLSADRYTLKNTVTTLGMTGVTASIHGPGCTAAVAGSASTTPGTLQVASRAGTLRVDPVGGTLRLWHVSGCSGLFASGDPLTVSAPYSTSVQENVEPQFCPPPFPLSTGFPFPPGYKPPPWPKGSYVIKSPPEPPSQGCAYIYGFSDVNKAKEAILTGPGLSNLQLGRLTVDNGTYCDPNRPKQCGYLQIDETGKLYYKPCPGPAPRCRPVNGLPPIQATLLTFGFMPTTATVQITQSGDLDVSTVAVGSIQLEARVESVISMRISDVLVNGVPLNVGRDCHTPAFGLTLNGLPGYNITIGGALAGTIDIPHFTGCGVGENLDPVFNAAVSGPGNYVQLTQGTVCGDWPPGSDSGCPPSVPKPIR